MNIPRHNLGFKFFGALEQCEDGSLCKASEVEDAYNLAVHELNCVKESLKVRVDIIEGLKEANSDLQREL